MQDEATGVEAPEVVEGNELEAAADEQQSESSTEQEAAKEPEGEAAPAEKTGEVNSGVQARINEITRKRREAERRADRAERKLKEYEGKNLDDLDYEDQVAERTLNRSRKEQVENDRETARELAGEAYRVRIEAAADKYPDFQQVAHGNHWNPTPAMVEVIMDSEMGPDIAYHLGKNPSEASRIAQLNPASQAAALGRLEAEISAPKSPKTPPPAPVKPVGAKASGGQKDPAKMSMSEYIAWRNAG